MAERRESVATRIPGAGMKMGRTVSEEEYEKIVAAQEQLENMPQDEELLEDDTHGSNLQEDNTPEPAAEPEEQGEKPIVRKRPKKEPQKEDDNYELSDEEFEAMRNGSHETGDGDIDDEEDEIFDDSSDEENNEDEPESENASKEPEKKDDKQTVNKFGVSPEQEKAIVGAIPLLRNGRTFYADNLEELRVLAQCGADFTVKTMMLSDDVKLAQRVKASGITEAHMQLVESLKNKDVNSVAAIVRKHGIELTDLVQADEFLSDTATPESIARNNHIENNMNLGIGQTPEPAYDPRVVADYRMMRIEDTQTADLMREAELSFPKPIRDEIVSNFDFYNELKRHVVSGNFEKAMRSVSQTLMSMPEKDRNSIVSDPYQFLYLYDSKIRAILNQEGNGSVGAPVTSDNRGASTQTTQSQAAANQIQTTQPAAQTQRRAPSTAPTGVKEKGRKEAYEDEVARINNDDEYFKSLFKKVTGRDIN
jgi:hypothetical protein